MTDGEKDEVGKDDRFAKIKRSLVQVERMLHPDNCKNFG